MIATLTFHGDNVGTVLENWFDIQNVLGAIPTDGTDVGFYKVCSNNNELDFGTNIYLLFEVWIIIYLFPKKI